jgi:predicted transcriptional regulator
VEVAMKLDETSVRYIRSTVAKRNEMRRELSNKMIARNLGVSVQAVRNVIKRKRWAWVK